MRQKLSVSDAIRIGVMLCFLSWLSIPALAQGGERWQRVFTGEEFSVDVDPASLMLGPDHIIRATFRTVFTGTETIGGNSGTKYKTRIETIEFKVSEKSYRIQEANLLDSSGKIVRTEVANSGEGWKILKERGFMERLSDVARRLPPFGRWKVVAYHYADAGPQQATEPPELSHLVGTVVSLKVDTAEVGAESCSSPAYQSRRMTHKEFMNEFLTSFGSIGIKAENVETIAVKCERSGWSPPQSLLIKLPEGDNLLMLWVGVFLELKREPH